MTVNLSTQGRVCLGLVFYGKADSSFPNGLTLLLSREEKAVVQAESVFSSQLC